MGINESAMALFLGNTNIPNTTTDSTGGAIKTMTPEQRAAYWRMKDMQAINAGKVNNTPIDTAKVKMAHDEWTAHLDKLGYEIVPKKKQ